MQHSEFQSNLSYKWDSLIKQKEEKNRLSPLSCLDIWLHGYCYQELASGMHLKPLDFAAFLLFAFHNSYFAMGWINRNGDVVKVPVVEEPKLHLVKVDNNQTHIYAFISDFYTH